MGIYVSNKGQHSLEGLVASIFEAFLNNVEKGFFERSFEALFGRLESVEVKGTKIRFQPDDETSRDLVASFHYIVNELINEEFDEYDCIFLVIDDINDLSEEKEFVNWYKRFADQLK